MPGNDNSKLTIGACTVTWGGVDLGHTIGGSVVTYTPEWADILADLYGNTKVDQRLLGESIEITMTLAQWVLDETLDAAAPIGGVESSTKREYGSSASQSLLTEAKELVLHPIRLAAGDRSEDIVVYQAAVSSAVAINYQNDTQKGIEVTWIGLIEESNSDGNFLFLIGDSTT